MANHAELIKAAESQTLTLAQVRELGYRNSDTTWERGYVSRRASRKPEDILINVAGGHRSGQLYYYAPNWTSTQYCVRVYLRQAQ